MDTRKSFIVFGLILTLLASLNGVIFAAEEAPILDIPTVSVLYTPGGSAVTLAPDLAITPVDTPNLDGATVLFDSNFSTGDQMVIGGATSGTSSGIDYSYNGTTGVMTLSGTASTDTYQTVLRSIQYQNSHGSPATASRNVTFTLGSQLANQSNGHYYEFVAAPQITWFNANTAANGSTFFGLQGYLATVTSDSENSFIRSKLTGQGWMGASDEPTLTGDASDRWYWMTGPESGNLFCVDNGPTCPAEPGWYVNWANAEPNNYRETGEIFGHFYEDGRWNDYVPGNPAIAGYVVEYGGMESDPILTITDKVVINYPGAVNQSPVIDDQTREVAENSADGTLVGAPLTATDPELGAMTFAITAGSGQGKFAIDNNGQLTVAGALDYETVSSYTLTVQVTDSGSLSDSADITITITDVDEIPANQAPSIDDQTREVVENSANGTLVGAPLTASDPEMGAMSFSITGGTGMGLFVIDNSGQLTVAGALDYETTAAYTLTVQVMDTGELTDSAIITVNITDEDETPTPSNVAPVLGAMDTQLVILGESVAFTATASDANVADTLSFSLGAGSPAGAAIDANSGAFTWTPDTYGVYTFSVIVSDNGAPVMSDQGDVTVRVGQEMVTNGDFSAFTSRLPGQWTTTKLVKKQVRVKCNKLTNNCFLRIRKTRSTPRSILTQLADETQVSLLQAGDQLVLSARVRTSRKAAKVIRVRVVYDDPTLGTNGVDVIAFRLPKTKEFQTLVSEPLMLKGTVDRLKLRLRSPKKGGKYALDDISVLVTPSATSPLNAVVMSRDGAMFEVPAAPTELRK